MLTRTLVAATITMTTADPALAIEIHCRIVEQLGPDHDDYAVLTDNRIVVRPGSSHRLRIQFMAHAEPGEDLDSFIGWNIGTIDTTGGTNTRTGRSPNPLPRGRIPPFTFAPSSPGEGLPRIDPFVALDSIDCTVGQQALVWNCGDPKPYPEGWGVDEFISTYEITSVAGTTNYQITLAGNAITAAEWRITQCVPPECGDPDNPDDDKPGYCPWAPFTNAPAPFTYELTVVVCPAEWNDDRSVNSMDFFDFLDDFFVGDADFNADMVTNSQDFFDYLVAFFTAC
jgi:hypothetical protein